MFEKLKGLFAPKIVQTPSEFEGLVRVACKVFGAAQEKYGSLAAHALGAFTKGLDDKTLKEWRARKILFEKKAYTRFWDKQDEEFHKGLDHVLLNDLGIIKKGVDPQSNKKSSFWTNMRAGAIYFIAGLILSPVAAIVCKHQLSDLDELLHPNDPKIEVCKEPKSEKAPQKTETKRDSQRAQEETCFRTKSGSPIPLEIGPYGLYDPTREGTLMDMLKAGRSVTFPSDGSTSFCFRPNRSVAPSQRLTWGL
jgi:hypothetical protein